MQCEHDRVCVIGICVRVCGVCEGVYVYVRVHVCECGKVLYVCMYVRSKGVELRVFAKIHTHETWNQAVGNRS